MNNNVYSMGFNDGYNESKEEVRKLIEKMLKRNDEMILSGKVLPKEIKIPFINGQELLNKLFGKEKQEEKK
jgi:hypothetical protein